MTEWKPIETAPKDGQIVTELLEALKKVQWHLAAVASPLDHRGNYHKNGTWVFDVALPRAADAREVSAAFEVVRAAIAKAGGQAGS